MTRRAVISFLLLTSFMSAQSAPAPKIETATLGAGCFWCVEAVFERLPGVKKVISGYTGGHVDNPTYKQICTGTTGHAEVARIEFDPAVVSFEKILEVFFEAHDPTTLNRQGADEGDQYRSAIFFTGEEQQQVALRAKTAAQKHWDDPIVTEVTPLGKFHPAEDYHQNYFKNNPSQGYCSYVIKPKVKKLVEKGVIQSERVSN